MMKPEQNQINRKMLKSDVQSLTDHLEMYVQYVSQNGHEHPFHLETQLKTVNASIEKLQRHNTPIPDDLRELKLKLISQIATEGELAEVKEILSTRLTQFLGKVGHPIRPKDEHAPANKNSHNYPAKKKTYKIKLHEVMQMGFLRPDTPIFHDLPDQTYRAVIKPFGRIEVTKNGRSKIVDSLSTAVRSLTGQSRNGWDWWYVRLENGKEVPISHFRALALKELNP